MKRKHNKAFQPTDSPRFARLAAAERRRCAADDWRGQRVSLAGSNSTNATVASLFAWAYEKLLASARHVFRGEMMATHATSLRPILWILLTLASGQGLASSGGIQSWISSDPYFDRIWAHQLIGYKGHLYVLGGRRGNPSYVTGDASKSQVGADGKPGPWLSTSAFAPARHFFGAALDPDAARIYIGGGLDENGQPLSDVRYARITPNGDLTTWTAATPLPDALFLHSMTVYKGYLLLLGGWILNSEGHQIGSKVTTLYYARIGSDGSLGEWQQNPTFYATGPIPYHAALGRYEDDLFAMGGANAYQTYSTAFTARLSEQSILNRSPALFAARETARLPQVRLQSVLVGANGRLYLLAGNNCFNDSGQPTPNVTVAQVFRDGTLGSWRETTPLPVALDDFGAVAMGGYIYVVGGFQRTTCGSGGYRSTVYYGRIDGADFAAPVTTAGTSPPVGTFATQFRVTLTCSDGAGSGCDKTYFTTNGALPSTSSTQYTSSFIATADTTVRFFSVDVAGNDESPRGIYLTSASAPPPQGELVRESLSFGYTLGSPLPGPGEPYVSNPVYGVYRSSANCIHPPGQSDSCVHMGEDWNIASRNAEHRCDLNGDFDFSDAGDAESPEACEARCQPFDSCVETFDAGRPVYALADGEVIAVGYQPTAEGWGGYVVVKHVLPQPNEVAQVSANNVPYVVSVCWHLNDPRQSAGMHAGRHVKLGDVIGHVGSPTEIGRRLYTHAHCELRTDRFDTRFRPNYPQRKTDPAQPDPPQLDITGVRNLLGCGRKQLNCPAGANGASGATEADFLPSAGIWLKPTDFIIAWNNSSSTTAATLTPQQTITGSASRGKSTVAHRALGIGGAPAFGATVSSDGDAVAFTFGGAPPATVNDDANPQTSADLVYSVALREVVGIDAERQTSGGRPSDYGIRYSANGRFKVFVSDSDMLVAGDNNRSSDIFLIDLVTGALERISVGTDNDEANGSSYHPAIAGDGRYVVFESTASNLVTSDTNQASDIFVRDRVTASTARVSVDLSGNEANGPSFAPAISADGRLVVFGSEATNLVSGDANGRQDVFLVNRISGAIERVSISEGGAEGNGNSAKPALSSAGNLIVFESLADNIVDGDSNGVQDIFAFNRDTRRLSVVSEAPDGTPSNGHSYEPSIAANGYTIAYASRATNLVEGTSGSGPFVYIRYTPTSASRFIAGGSGGGGAGSSSGGGAFPVYALGGLLAGAIVLAMLRRLTAVPRTSHRRNTPPGAQL